MARLVDVQPTVPRQRAANFLVGRFHESQHETRRTVATSDELEDSQALFERTQQLYNLGCPRSELIRRLNDEGFRPARKNRFTKTSINALMLVLRRKGMVGARPAVAKPFWRSKELSNALGIKPSTLSGWRRRGWLQAKKSGNRWIYWADDVDLPRLKKLAAHPPSGSAPAPQQLTAPAAIMPIGTS
ncbi:MAG: MerR family transcriptional regulator [Pirellulales bacterium]|nr:MerR family transcriptional regulator [Pirellulales bacterium]